MFGHVFLGLSWGINATFGQNESREIAQLVEIGATPDSAALARLSDHLGPGEKLQVMGEGRGRNPSAGPDLADGQSRLACADQAVQHAEARLAYHRSKALRSFCMVHGRTSDST
jgi:hypothetical protein